MKYITFLSICFALFAACVAPMRQDYFGTDRIFDSRSGWKRGKYCYTTRHKITIRREAGSICPEQADIEDQTTRLLKRMGASQEALAGSSVTFVHAWLTFNGGYAYGIAAEDGAVVRLAGPWKVWMNTYAHEITHILLYRAEEKPDILHYAYNPCPTTSFPDKDACELLPAATALDKDTPQLSKGNRFLKKFRDI